MVLVVRFFLFEIRKMKYRQSSCDTFMMRLMNTLLANDAFHIRAATAPTC